MSTRRNVVVVVACLFAAAAALIFKLGGGSLPTTASATPTTTSTVPAPPVPPSNCNDVQGDVPTWFAKMTTGNKFGPAAPFDKAPALAVGHQTFCLDASIESIDHEAVVGQFSTPVERANKTRQFVADRSAWLADLGSMEAILSTAKDVRVEVHTGPYQTFYMTTNGDVPQVFQGAGSFTVTRHVLVFEFKDGHTVGFVLECHLQPELPGPVNNVPTSPPAVVTPATPAQPTPVCTQNCTPTPVCTQNCTPPPCRVNCTPPPCTQNCTAKGSQGQTVTTLGGGGPGAGCNSAVSVCTADPFIPPDQRGPTGAGGAVVPSTLVPPTPTTAAPPTTTPAGGGGTGTVVHPPSG